MRVPPGAKAVARIREAGLEDRLQHLMQRLLDQSIHHRRYPQRPHPALASGSPPSHRLRQVTARQQLRFDCRPVLLQLVFELAPPRCHRLPLRPCSRPPAGTPATVAAFDHCFHQLVAPPLSFAHMSPRETSAPVAALTASGRHLPYRSRVASASASSVRIEILPSYLRSLMFGPSVRGAPTMASADF